MKHCKAKSATPQRPPKNAKPVRHNRELAAQSRKILGRHYAAKYRVR